MLLTEKVEKSIESSVLCWLATVSEDGTPNVSPKEAFLHDGDGKILIAHIASPQTVLNIEQEPRVCVSFVNVITQRGYKVKGTARILKRSDTESQKQWSLLNDLVGRRFRILAVIEIQPSKIEEIIAPSYRMFPNVTTDDMVRQSLHTYKVVDYQKRVEASESAE